jgi:hypothetical protein
MDFLTKALQALPLIATSPLAFLGYVLTLVAWVYAVFRSRRLKLILARLPDIPETDRAKTIQLELGEVLPANITAEEWLRGKRQKYFFVAFVLLLVTFVSIVAVAIYQGRARLVIKKSSAAAGFIRVQLNEATASAPLHMLEDTAEKLKYRYTFDITLRNPSPEPVNATELRIIFDSGKGGGLANVQEVTGTYVVAINSSGATTLSPVGRLSAYAWYPSGSGRLHVKTPIAQTLAPRSVDRIRIIVEFPNDYSFLGPMEEAVLEVYWNSTRYERSAPIRLATR